MIGCGKISVNGTERQIDTDNDTDVWVESIDRLKLGVELELGTS